MNFTIKYHKPAQAMMCLQGKPRQDWSNSQSRYGGMSTQKVCSFKDVNYDTNQTLYDTLLHGLNTNSSYAVYTYEQTRNYNDNLFYNMTAYASSEKQESFNEDAYKVESQVGTATQSFSNGYTNNTYSVSVSNVSGQEDIKVNCIKFVKTLIPNAVDQTNLRMVNCLVYSCYLDEEVTIPAGSEKVFVVVFNFLNP